MKMPVKLFRMMDSMTDRLKAYEELSQFNVQTVANAEGSEEVGEMKQKYVEGLIKRTGPVMVIESDDKSPVVNAPELDREGLHELKMMF